jgi:hypothetical protein
MKKRVRIYKNPNGKEGSFINKTAQFLNKAKVGGTPSIDMLGYPGANTEQSAQMGDDELASEVLQSIVNEEPRERIIIKLVNVYGKNPMEAEQFVDQMYQYVEQQNSESVDEEPVIQAPEEIEYDASEEEQPIYDDTSTDNSEEILNLITDDDDDFMMKFGGSKKSYVSSVLKLAKKEMGGNNKPDEFTDGIADPTGADVRKQALNKFIGSVKNQSEIALIKKQAEEEYDNMMQMQQFPVVQEGGDMENPMHHLAAFSQYSNNVFDENQNGITQAQFGGLFRRMRERKGRRGIPSQFIENMPVSHIDVRKSGLFGTPKRYSIDYDPMLNMPNMDGSAGSYSTPSIRKFDAVKKKIEKINKKAIEEVSASTPDSQATSDAANEECIEETSTEGTVASSTVPGNVQPTQTVTTAGKTETTPVNPTVVKPTVTETEVETEIKPGGVIKTPKTGIELTYTKDRKGAAFYQKDGKYYIIPDIYNYYTSYEVTDPKRIENIKKFKGNQSLYYQYIPGKDFNYKRNKYGEWEYQPADAKRNDSGYVDETANNWNLVTNPETLKTLANGPKSGKGSRSQELVLVKTKPGYYYRERNDGSYEKFEGNVTDHYSGKKSIGIITDPKQIEYIQNNHDYAPDINPSKKAPKSTVNYADYNALMVKNPVAMARINKITDPDERQAAINYLLYNIPLKSKQEGGNVNNPFADMYGNLQQFVGGGNEDFTQADLDDVYSKNTSNANFPMAKYGGLTEYQDKGEVSTDCVPDRNGEITNCFPNKEDDPKVYDDKSIEALIEAYLKKKEVDNRRQPGYYNPYQRQQPYYNSPGRTVMKGTPYDPVTGMPITSYIPGVGTHLKNIDVKRSSWLTGAPKKYSMTFGTQELDPRKQNLILPPGVSAKDYPSWAADKSNAANLSSDTVPVESDNPNYYNPIWQSLNEADPNTLDTTVDTTVESDNPNESNPNWNSSDKTNRYRGIKSFLPRVADKPYRYRGLKRFLPRAQNGQNVLYTSNPMMNGLTESDLIEGEKGIQGLQPSPITNAMDTSWMTNSNSNITVDQSQLPKTYTIDPNQLNSYQVPQTYQGPDQDIKADFKVKNNNAENRFNLDLFNAGSRGVANGLEQFALKESNDRMYNNLLAENLYGLDESKDRGNYDTNSGLFRPDQMGQTQYSKYGGDVYQDGGMIEGDEVEMTEEEIQEFLANGGTLEFI